MEEPATYIIRARLTADGVIERSDVVGAIFGQTEGLLGTEMDLRTLQEAERVGRIDVEIESAAGRSTGTIAIDTDLGRTETAVLAAALETIERVGPCRATISVDRIEDVRAAKRRMIVDRARELIADGFEDAGLAGRDLVSAVREGTKAREMTEYAGYPAGPDVAEGEEIIIVEGRADVRRLLQFGIGNVVGVEGTDVPEEIAELTADRTVTAFFDGDRGGNLLLLELAQRGEVDFVTFAPPGQSVEDLTAAEVHQALREKVPYESDTTQPAFHHESEDEERALLEQLQEFEKAEPGTVWMLDAGGTILDTGEIEDLDSLRQGIGETAETILVADEIDQELLDSLVDSGVSQVIGRSRGEFTKRPTEIRVITTTELLDRAPAQLKAD